ncbi:UNVERIFIED_CONTAM: hypothetical protein K2H54_060415 [Gekko kuhli]
MGEGEIPATERAKSLPADRDWAGGRNRQEPPGPKGKRGTHSPTSQSHPRRAPKPSPASRREEEGEEMDCSRPQARGGAATAAQRSRCPVLFRIAAAEFHATNAASRLPAAPPRRGLRPHKGVSAPGPRSRPSPSLNPSINRRSTKLTWLGTTREGIWTSTSGSHSPKLSPADYNRRSYPGPALPPPSKTAGNAEPGTIVILGPTPAAGAKDRFEPQPCFTARSCQLLH